MQTNARRSQPLRPCKHSTAKMWRLTPFIALGKAILVLMDAPIRLNVHEQKAVDILGYILCKKQSRQFSASDDVCIGLYGGTWG